ncbi:MAG: Transcriptional regulator [candidate division TM6 bacterium GW2011_GWF2_43_17]|nr:MAG: Transcriptional regulator [candidate division TM6 bacterium GW2011_GWF2_43_17]HAU30157.1 MerR family transcriptional regulator [Candidatus Dependentiae bacterium]
MRVSKKTFRIGTLAQTLADQGVHAEPSAIRFWEKEFSIQPKRSKKGHRFYTQEDINRFITIYDLLHNKKFTIAGAKKLLAEGPAVETNRIKIQRLDENHKNTAHICSLLSTMKTQLIALKKIL